MNKKVEIRESKIAGTGVFALTPFKKNEKIFQFSNNIIKLNHKEGCDCKICCRCINIKKGFWLYPSDNPLGWNLNHSCNPNAYFLRKNIFALKRIKKSEEITIDYSTTTIDKKWENKCSCKSKNCRKIIKSIQFLPKKLFKKYKNKMPKFIEKEYEKQK